jgi:hypothetical protein
MFLNPLHPKEVSRVLKPGKIYALCKRKLGNNLEHIFSKRREEMVYLSNLYVAIFTQYLTDLQQTDEHWME